MMTISVFPSSGDFAAARNECSMAVAMGPKPIAYRPDLLPAGGEFKLELKHNGITFNWVDGRAYSNEAVPMRCCDHLVPAFEALEKISGEPMYFQGEYMVDQNNWRATMSAFNTGTPSGIVALWEAVPMTVYHGRQVSQPLHVRRQHLETILDVVQPHGILGQRWETVESEEQIELGAGVAWDEGAEGVVIKDPTSPFVRGPSRYWLKIKQHETLDVTIVDVRLDTDEAQPRVKSLLCREGDGAPFRVATGFGNEERYVLGFIHASGMLVGTVCEVKSQGRTAEGIPENPSYLRLREDK